MSESVIKKILELPLDDSHEDLREFILLQFRLGYCGPENETVKEFYKNVEELHKQAEELDKFVFPHMSLISAEEVVEATEKTSTVAWFAGVCDIIRKSRSPFPPGLFLCFILYKDEYETFDYELRDKIAAALRNPPKAPVKPKAKKVQKRNPSSNRGRK